MTPFREGQPEPMLISGNDGIYEVGMHPCDADRAVRHRIHLVNGVPHIAELVDRLDVGDLIRFTRLHA